MIVFAKQLLDAADRMDADGKRKAALTNGVTVTAPQLRTAGVILRDGPQPICNGIRDDMPGFIEPEAQTGKSLVFQVGILPSRTHRIDSLGRRRATS